MQQVDVKCQLLITWTSSLHVYLKKYKQAAQGHGSVTYVLLQIAAMEKEKIAAKKKNNNREGDVNLHDVADKETNPSKPQQTLMLLF